MKTLHAKFYASRIKTGELGGGGGKYTNPRVWSVFKSLSKIGLKLGCRTFKFLKWRSNKGGSPLIAEITCCHTFTKEINYASGRSHYFDENFYCKNCLRVFSAMKGTAA